MEKMFVSFSGGKTSAYMTYLIKKMWAGVYEIAVVFANTGQEHESTLKFVRDCDTHLNFNTIWVEAVIHAGRKGTSHKIVNFNTADRVGRVFEDMIKKYGVPNKAYPHCTRELKLRPMNSYIKELGWVSYKTAIGIREDEPSRVSKLAEDNNWVYPLVHDWPSDKEDIESFWEEYPFSLDIPPRLGNCMWCWKKTDSKHYSNIKEINSVYDFPARMELEWGLCGNGRDLKDLGSRTFFRGHRSTIDMREGARAILEDSPNISIDSMGISECGESCEAYV